MKIFCLLFEEFLSSTANHQEIAASPEPLKKPTNFRGFGVSPQRFSRIPPRTHHLHLFLHLPVGPQPFVDCGVFSLVPLIRFVHPVFFVGNSTRLFKAPKRMDDETTNKLHFNRQFFLEESLGSVFSEVPHFNKKPLGAACSFFQKEKKPRCGKPQPLSVRNSVQIG